MSSTIPIKRKRKITCPESAHLEEIEYEADAEGRILRILRCTRFTPSDALECDEECAHRLNRRLERSRR